MRLFGRNREDELEVKLARVSRRLDALIDHLGVEIENELLPPDAQERIRLALARGKKIDAIKAYRAATCEGLQEAKAAVEEMQRRQR